MTKGDDVFTPFGKGNIVEVEEYSRLNEKRFGIILEKNPFLYSPVYFFEHECVLPETVKDNIIFTDGIPNRKPTLRP